MPTILELHDGTAQPSGRVTPIESRVAHFHTDKYIKNVFGWDHFFTYLGGPMDFAPDGGFGWRRKLTEDLVRLGFRRNQIFNPTKKPLTQTPFDLDNEAEIMRELRQKGDWEGMCSVMGQLAHVDLRLVDKSDIIIVHFPLDSEGYRVNTYGTMHEIVVARQQHKPVMVVWEGGRGTCSGWVMWLVGYRNIFATFDELIEEMRNIAGGKESYDPQDWLLINYEATHAKRTLSGF